MSDVHKSSAELTADAPFSEAPPVNAGPDAAPAAASLDGEGARARAQRSQLVRALTDTVVLPARRVSANERALIADMLLEVFSLVEPALRVEVAIRIARVREAPPVLVREILLDDPKIAEAYLGAAESAPAVLLAECARRGLTAHRRAIAKRPDLSPHVADALLEYDEPEVTALILKRTGCELSPYALDLLLARSAADPTLQTLLLQRADLEPAHGFIMFWWSDAERRRRILARFAVNRSTIQDAVEDLYPQVFNTPGADPMVKDILNVLDRRFRPRSAKGEPASVDFVARTLSAARGGEPQQFAAPVGRIAGISRELATRILRDPGGEAFAVLGKGAGLPRDKFMDILTRPSAIAPFTADRREELTGIFDSLARDYARAILRYWDWEGNPRIAQITRLLGLSDDG
ncbi:MAG: DUF2336 domain-containing protein [Pseudomonadota bacterium]